jgi:hypothetical protein
LLPFQMFASFYLGVAEKEMKVFYSLNSRWSPKINNSNPSTKYLTQIY